MFEKLKAFLYYKTPNIIKYLIIIVMALIIHTTYIEPLIPNSVVAGLVYFFGAGLLVAIYREPPKSKDK